MIRALAPLAPAAVALTFVLASCDASQPVAPEASNADVASADLGNEAVVTANVTGGAPPTGNSSAEPNDSTASATIPAALRGRWGMVPEDCTSTRGDAKGLLVISADQLKFYESIARPASGVEGSGDSISGRFNFTGEGMTWTRFQSLEIQDGKLVRTENEPASSYTYVRCD